MAVTVVVSSQATVMTSGFPASDDRRVRNAYDYMWQKANRP